MKYQQILDLLQSYVPPEGWQANLFLLPLEAMHDICKFIIENKSHSCIELGTGFGATACVMAAAMEEVGGGQVMTVDMYLHQPVNVKVLMQHTGQNEESPDIIADTFMIR